MMRKSSHRKTKEEGRLIASERIGILFGLADREAISGDLERAGRHVAAARRLAMKFNVRIPKQYRGKYCRHCYCYLLPGKNSRFRLSAAEKRVEVYCFTCHKKAYHPYVAEVRAKRRLKACAKAG